MHWKLEGNQGVFIPKIFVCLLLVPPEWQWLATGDRLFEFTLFQSVAYPWGHEEKLGSSGSRFPLNVLAFGAVPFSPDAPGHHKARRHCPWSSRSSLLPEEELEVCRLRRNIPDRCSRYGLRAAPTDMGHFASQIHQGKFAMSESWKL